MRLPPPSADQAYCDVSALEGGHIKLPKGLVMKCDNEDEVNPFPASAFLLRHSRTQDTFLLDIGIRKDWQTGLPPPILRIIRDSPFRVYVPEDVPTALAKGGLKPADIQHICFTHIHFDHVGVPNDYTNATFLIGEGARALLENGYPKNPNSVFDVDLFPADRTRFLSPSSKTDAAEWKPLGPFRHTFDFYGDGSLYIIDAPGHMAGHLMVLARTSSDGGWMMLAGDAAHDWKILRGEAEIGIHSRLGCMHKDRESAEDTIRAVKEVLEEPRVRTVLSHDQPWYEARKGSSDFWPGKFESL
ncbi:hypothetical protein EIP91_004605 [Steccherinum ochraceum]|uniref:Metallo-beta-lactamase domain-containing protein n=1 Tax=Steccherinum ochraceum TaxID=92696 RepID=A0A4R0RB27_9APHY|nr:hypothetical protein EIP91_004605 [Steccherinum ochraceum]